MRGSTVHASALTGCSTRRRARERQQGCSAQGTTHRKQHGDDGRATSTSATAASRAGSGSGQVAPDPGVHGQASFGAVQRRRRAGSARGDRALIELAEDDVAAAVDAVLRVAGGHRDAAPRSACLPGWPGTGVERRHVGRARRSRARSTRRVTRSSGSRRRPGRRPASLSMWWNGSAVGGAVAGDARSCRPRPGRPCRRSGRRPGPGTAATTPWMTGRDVVLRRTAGCAGTRTRCPSRIADGGMPLSRTVAGVPRRSRPAQRAGHVWRLRAVGGRRRSTTAARRTNSSSTSPA